MPDDHSQGISLCRQNRHQRTFPGTSSIKGNPVLWGAYPELIRNQDTILETITREEEQFQKTLDKATNHLLTLLENRDPDGSIIISGEQAADLYTTYGLPLEITRDIAQEQGFRVDESGFLDAMEIHRQASGAGKAMGALGGEDVDLYRSLLDDFQIRRTAFI